MTLYQAPQVFCLGEVLIDFIPIEGNAPLSKNPGFYHHPGGAPANVAVGLAQLNTSTALLTQVGDDLWGEYLIQALQAKGVDTHFISKTHMAPTALAFVSLTANGERAFAFYRNPCADALYAPKDLPLGALSQAQSFHFGSISMISQSARQATFQALQTAQENQLIISFDPNIRHDLWADPETARALILKAIPLCHILKISETEHAFLFPGQTFETACQSIHQQGPKLIAITLGARGVYLSTPDETLRVPAYDIYPVDTTGAGDGFMAGFLHSILSHPQILDKPVSQYIQDCVLFGNATAALVCSQKGAIQSMPNLKAVKAFIRSQNQV